MDGPLQDISNQIQDVSEDKAKSTTVSSWTVSGEGSSNNPSQINVDLNTGSNNSPSSVKLASKEFRTKLNLLDVEKQTYVDLGEMDMICKCCGATLWHEELAEKTKSSIDPVASICCSKEKISIPYLKDPPQLLLDLLTKNDPRSQNFLDNIRSYNSMFAFTSIGGKIISNVNDGHGPPQFIIGGQNYHRIGSLLPDEGSSPKFAQLYIYDTKNEVENRLKHFSNNGDSSLDPALVADLIKMVDEFNRLAQTFRKVRDYVEQGDAENVSLRLFRSCLVDPNTYNLPSVNEVAALIVGDFDSSDCGRDIILRTKNGHFQRIYENHSSFLPLQYPILFPYGEKGFSDDIDFANAYNVNTDPRRDHISLREWVVFRLFERRFECKRIFLSKRLFQQFVVDCYSMVESQRLYYYRNNQTSIRRHFLEGIEEAMTRGDTCSSTVGSKVYLPASFKGGKRDMFNNCQDAMAISNTYGYPDLFLTITCNPKWPEIDRHVYANGLSASDRPDLACRVFHMKLNALIIDLKNGDFFGKAIAGTYNIEFQKRGLPHAHILLWLSTENKLRSPNMIDFVICAELPDPEGFPKLFECVSNYMVHGPCGLSKRDSPCMKNGHCSKFFPKKFVAATTFDSDGYPIYKRRNTGVVTIRKGVPLDNRYVVPYNPKLLMKYRAHINIEYCNKANSIKYLFKYINKGVDRVTMSMSVPPANKDREEEVDEIKQYYDCRYLSPCEALWRLFGFEIHCKWPPVKKLIYHLPKKQVVLFKEEQPLRNVYRKNKLKDSMFTAWMVANAKYAQGRHLTYVEFPAAFVFDENIKNGNQGNKALLLVGLTLSLRDAVSYTTCDFY
ncbi:uncharacterized protein LOC130743773 [Lotus japonicus]|uniref:uncharacterized protein LOC130743773 n=1 Tax=Lotus japonicus TaxID=34305 RepID=UPI0025900493|nr:uncharacterized protein LOC130743773 [Lotus japonicus]